MQPLFNKHQALKLMKEGKRVQHIDWLEDGGSPYQYYTISVHDGGNIVTDEHEVVDMDYFLESFADGKYWQVAPEPFEHYKNFKCFLKNLGYSEATIESIARGNF